MDPLLIGPEAKIRAAAAEAGVSLDSMAIESTEYSHAAARAVELAASRRVDALVKGSLHSDELPGARVPILLTSRADPLSHASPRPRWPGCWWPAWLRRRSAAAPAGTDGTKPERVETMPYRESGLLGVSGINAGSRELLASPRPEPAEAV